jgi:hypothetical protein
MPTVYSSMPVKTTPYSSSTYTGGSVPASYDICLYPGSSPGGPYLYPGSTVQSTVAEYKLTLKVRLKLQQMAPTLLPITLDADDKPFWTSPWNNASWQQFVGTAAAQADMWNNRFWLQAPSTPTYIPEYDVVVKERPNQAFRPNIRCALDVNLNPTGSTAHRTISVANLDVSKLGSQPASPGVFRSHSLLWDSLDGIPWAFPWGPGAQNPTVHPVIAHEIGHLIGLGHIGTILKTPLCELAQSLKDIGYDYGQFNGGRNSHVCYGGGQGAAISGNIMGAGDAFTVHNALPWIWSLLFMFPKTMGYGWRAVLRDPGPGSWLTLTA